MFALLVDHDVWQAEGACVVPEDAPAGAREAMWAAIDEPAESPERLAMLRGLCGSCPVVRECGEHAERERLRHGFFGGLTGEERRARRAGDFRAHELLVSAPRQQPQLGRHGGDRRSVGYLVSAESDALGDAGRFDAEVERCVSRLHALGVRHGVGRDEARDALRADGFRVSPAVLAAAVRQRQPGGSDYQRPQVGPEAARDGVVDVAEQSAAVSAVGCRPRRPLVLVGDSYRPARWYAAAERFAALGGSACALPACCSSALRPAARSALSA